MVILTRRIARGVKLYFVYFLLDAAYQLIPIAFWFVAALCIEKAKKSFSPLFRWKQTTDYSVKTPLLRILSLSSVSLAGFRLALHPGVSPTTNSPTPSRLRESASRLRYRRPQITSCGRCVAGNIPSPLVDLDHTASPNQGKQRL